MERHQKLRRLVSSLEFWQSEKFWYGRGKDFYIHRLVAETFIPNPKNLPQVDHIDTDKANCRVENLRWATGEENRKYAAEKGLAKEGEDRPDAKLTNEQVIYIRENPDGLNTCQLAETQSQIE